MLSLSKDGHLFENFSFLHAGNRLVIPIENRSSIIFDWSVVKQSIFISIIDFQSLNFGMIKWSIFLNFFPIFFFLIFFTNEYAKWQYATLEKPKEKFHSRFSIYFLSLLLTVSLINFFETDFSIFLVQLINQSIDRSINFSIFFNRSIEFFDFLKWSIID